MKGKRTMTGYNNNNNNNMTAETAAVIPSITGINVDSTNELFSS